MFWKNKKRIYMDYAGATPVLPKMARAVRRAQDLVGNPGSIHKDGVKNARLLEQARKDIAMFLGCTSKEVVYTSGGTEANNLAIVGYANYIEKSGKELSDTHWITTTIEHSSVLECFRELERRGANISYVSPNKNGVVSADSIKNKLKENTVFVSVGWANGEIGTIQPISAISKAIQNFEQGYPLLKVVLHTDAGQAPLYFSSQVHSLGVDMMTIDSGKLYGPRGVGVLYKDRKTKIEPIMFGGGQEGGLRPGTENVVLAVGLAKALNIISKYRGNERNRLEKLRELFLKNVTGKIPGVIINGTGKKQLPHIINISVPNIQSEYAVLSFDHKGISISTKSACNEGEERESHVVRELTSASDVENWRATNTLRFSFGIHTTRSDIENTIKILLKL